MARQSKRPVLFAEQYQELYLGKVSVNLLEDNIRNNKSNVSKAKGKMKEVVVEENVRVTRSKAKALAEEKEVKEQKKKVVPQKRKNAAAARQRNARLAQNMRNRNRNRVPFRAQPQPFLFGFGGLQQQQQVGEEVDEPEVETVSMKRRNEGIEFKWKEDITVAELDVHKETLKQTLPQISELISLDDINSNDLLNILDETKFEEDDLAAWGGFGGGRMWNTPADLKHGLKTVVDYCEGPKEQTGKGLRERLRLVTKVLKEDHASRTGVLALLAQHGNVCNVMKEVGVNMAYSLVKNEAKEYSERESLKGKILRQLDLLKEIIVEELYKQEHNYAINTHPLVGYRNGLCPHIGLDVIPDMHTGNNPATKKRISKFMKTYTPERILQTVSIAINENPRKIPYDVLVEWFQQNSPIEDAYEFLTQCFDENGKFTNASLLYLLFKLEILY